MHDATDTPFCEKCRFFKAKSESDDTIGDCRRNPPTVSNGITRFPRVMDDDWCGEYRRKDF